MTREKARTAADYLASNGKIPVTFSANLAGETSRYMTQLELQNKEGHPQDPHGRGGGYFHGKQPDINTPSGRTIFASIPLGWVGLGAKHGLCFDKHQRGGPVILRVAGNVPGL